MKVAILGLVVLAQAGTPDATPSSKDVPPLSWPLPASVTPPNAEPGGACSHHVHPHVPASDVGSTILSFIITREGAVKNVKVEQASGDAAVDQEAADCASNWHFKPAMQNNQPIEVIWRTRIQWSRNPR